MSIQDWPEQERPRERLLTLGANALDDSELLAIFLRTGVKGCSAVDLAEKLLDDFGGLQGLLGASEELFCQAYGLGPAKYVQLQAVLEMASRYYQESIESKPIFSNSETVKQWLQIKMRAYEKEVFACLFLNSQHELLEYEEVFQGTINRSPVYPREVAKLALHYNAAAVIFAHNHPSGHSQPSQADEAITQELKQALSLLDVNVLDHFVVAKTQVFSFAQNGLL
ncbi:MAG: DNA repair protein RadC [Sinobacterium sp.]|nr:DNA repair protein RadC [Sinobacterium sp.]